MKAAHWIFWLTLLAVVVTVNGLAYQRERLMAEGQRVYLALAPVDPRSLLQGDYMALRYALADEIGFPTRGGQVVVRLAENEVGTFARLHDPAQPLAADEVVLTYAARPWGASVGPESFFFEEGQAEMYAEARYAELRVSATGEVALISLRDAALKPLGPP